MGTNRSNEESLEDMVNRLNQEIVAERKIVSQLRNFIEIIDEGWSADRRKLVKTKEKLRKIEAINCTLKQQLLSQEKDNQDKFNRLEHELTSNQQTVAELRNFIDVMRIGWSSDKAKLLQTTEKLNKNEVNRTEKETIQLKKKLKKMEAINCTLEQKLSSQEKDNQDKFNRLEHELTSKQQTVAELRNFIDVMRTGWSSDKAKLLLATEKLNKIEVTRIHKLEHELTSEQQAIAELHNLIDVVRADWSSDKEKLLQATEKLNKFEVNKTEKEIIQTKPERDNTEDMKENVTKGNITIKRKISINSDENMGRENETKKFHIKVVTPFASDPLRNAETPLILCPLCQITSFPSQEDFKHCLHDFSENMFCSMCHQRFISMTTFISHLESDCNGNTKFELDKKFVLPLVLEDQDCAENKANLTLECSLCQSFFKTIAEAQNHKLLHTSELDAAKCHLCCCVFSNETDLNKHLKSEHDADTMKKPRYETRSLSTSSSSTFDTDNKQPFDIEKTISEMQKNEVHMQHIKPVRSKRKRKINKNIFDESFVY